jgi:hypothetical protein
MSGTGTRAGRRVVGGAVLVAGLALLAGCSGAPDESPGAAGQPGPGGDASTEWDALRDELIASRGAQLLRDGLLDSLPTDAQFVRYLDPGEWAEVRAQCLLDQGFHADATPDGGLIFRDYPEEQQKPLHEATYRCDVMYPVHPVYEQQLDDGQLTLLYDYYLDALRPCLEAEGFDIAEPPSLETFIDSYYRDGSWNPYSSVPSLPLEEWYRLQEECPQTPPLAELYGEDLP